MLLNEKLHSVSDVLEETRDNGFAHPRTIVDTVNSSEVLVSVSEVLVQPFVDSTNWLSCSKR